MSSSSLSTSLERALEAPEWSAENCVGKSTSGETGMESFSFCFPVEPSKGTISTAHI